MGYLIQLISVTRGALDWMKNLRSGEGESEGAHPVYLVAFPSLIPELPFYW